MKSVKMSVKQINVIPTINRKLQRLTDETLPEIYLIRVVNQKETDSP